MPLEFKGAPDWLLQEYMARKTPYQEASQGIQTALGNYLAIDEAKRKNMLAQQEIANRQEQNRLTALSQFQKSGNPDLLPKDVQPLLNPVEGPSAIVDYWTAQKAQTGGGEGPALPMEQPPAENPRAAYYKNFMQQYPQGTEGMTTDTIFLRDEKGNVIGSQQVQRPKSGRTIVPGMPTRDNFNRNLSKPQQTQFTDENGRPLVFTPNTGYSVAPVSPGVNPVLRKGDESAIADATLISAQIPQVDILFDAYKNKGEVSSRAQATPLGYVLDPAVKQAEDSLKLAAFTFGGKNLTGQEKQVVFGAFFPKWTDNDQARENKRELLKKYFTGKIDLLQAANLLGPAGEPLRKMLEGKSALPPKNTGTTSSSDKTGMEQLSDEELRRIING